jgi:hypothetical protein
MNLAAAPDSPMKNCRLPPGRILDTATNNTQLGEKERSVYAAAWGDAHAAAA